MTKKVVVHKKVTKRKAAAQKPEPTPLVGDESTTYTNSRVSAHLKCPRLHWYQYEAGTNGVGVESTQVNMPFVEGEFGHYVLEHYYKNAARGGMMLRANMIKRIDAMVDDMGAIEPELHDKIRVKMAAMVGACHGYKMVYKSDFDRYDVLFVEEAFELKLGGFTVEGVLDLGVRDKETGKVGFFDHKFLSTISKDAFAILPLNLQVLIYTMGFEALTGELPDWYSHNIIRKSALRRKKLKTGGQEPFPQFEVRVQDQYVKEPEKMFFRTPPRPVEEKVFKRVQWQLLQHMEDMMNLRECDSDKLPMCFNSCSGKFDTPCFFSEACTAYLTGHPTGWDAPQCRGKYRSKNVLHPEVERVRKVK